VDKTVTPGAAARVRAAELVGAISLATDLGTGQPLEHALRTAVLAERLADRAAGSQEEIRDTYYVALLHAPGCTSTGPEATQVFDEDIVHRAAFFLIDPSDVSQVIAFYRAHVAPGRPPEVREQVVEAVLANPEKSADSFAAMCEVAQRFAGWLALGAGIEASLEFVFARWDGRGWPRGVGGEDLPFPARVLHVARDYSLFLTAGGRDDARAVLERRSGEAYDPRLVGLALACFDDTLSQVDETRMWNAAMDSEPWPQVVLADSGVDAGFGAVAALTNLKSPWLREHATNVADLAEAAAWRLQLSPDVVAVLRRAALAHDLGRVGVSNAIWEKPGPLAFGEWERVRLHPHFTERAFAQSTALAPIGLLAGSHHERLDGSGYHRGARAPALDLPARLLAAADCYSAMREARAHRPALEPEEAEAELVREATDGRLDRDAVDAVLAAAGHQPAKRPRELPAGLTQRELEVLLALVVGQSNQAIADSLGISAKTVGHHVQHVYRKAGVRSRAAATVWAFENELVHRA
jgi:HD-GYP domain-containing protein (c-di-GMP phosphodiesterase class II)